MYDKKCKPWGEVCKNGSRTFKLGCGQRRCRLSGAANEGPHRRRVGTFDFCSFVLPLLRLMARPSRDDDRGRTIARKFGASAGIVRSGGVCRGGGHSVRLAGDVDHRDDAARQKLRLALSRNVWSSTKTCEFPAMPLRAIPAPMTRRLAVVQENKCRQSATAYRNSALTT